MSIRSALLHIPILLLAFVGAAGAASAQPSVLVTGFEDAVPSARWGNGRMELTLDASEKTEGRQSLRMGFDVPEDGHSGFTIPLGGSFEVGRDGALSMWVRADSVAGLIIDVNTDQSFANPKYFRAVRKIDRQGWRQVILNRTDFGGAPEEYWKHAAAVRIIVQPVSGSAKGTLWFDDLRLSGARLGEPVIPDGWLWDDPTEAAPMRLDQKEQASILARLDTLPIDDPAAIAISQAKGLLPVADALAKVGFQAMSDPARSIGLWYMKVGSGRSQDKMLFPFRKSVDFPVRYKRVTPIDWEKLSDSAVKAVEAYAPAPKDKKIINVYLIPRSHEDIAGYGYGGPGDYNQKLKLALDMMDAHPEFCWSCEQACLIYAYWISHPEDRGRITRYVRNGRLEVMAPWQLFYGTQEHGEALIRSIAQAQDWMRKTFGVNADILCRSDSSAQPEQLPQIAAKLGVKSLFLQFHNTVDEDIINPPARPGVVSEFVWRTPDGSSVDVHRMVRWYCGIGFDPLEKMSKEERFKLIDGWIKSLLPSAQSSNIHLPLGSDFAPPRPILIQTVRDWNTEIFPKTGYRLIFGTPSMYMAAVRKEVREQGRSLKVVNGGDFGSPWWIGGFMESPLAKEIMRRAETRLLDAETLAAVASMEGMRYPHEMLSRGWGLLARMYKHDGIEGSTSDYIRAGSITGMSDWILDRSLKQISSTVDTSKGGQHPLLIFNPLGWTHTDVISADVSLPSRTRSVRVIDVATGKETPSELRDGRVLFTAKDVPSVGYRLYRLEPSADVPARESDLRVNGSEIENRYFRLTISPDNGGTMRLWDKDYGKEVLNGALRMRDLIDAPYVGGGQGIFSLGTSEVRTPTAPATVRIVEQSPKLVRVSVETSLDTVKVRTELTIYDDTRRIDAHTTLDLSGIPTTDKTLHTYTIEFPFTEDGEWTHATPYGLTPRQATEKDYVVNDYFLCRESSDCSNDRYGIALLSRDMQTFRVFGHRTDTLALCRFNSPERWVSQTNCSATYAIYPHRGDRHSAEVYKRGIEFNHPLIPMQVTVHSGQLPPSLSFISVEGKGVVLTVLKRGNEDRNAVVVRLLETRGQAATARIHSFRPLSNVALADPMEHATSALASPDSEIKLKPKEFVTVIGDR